MTSSHRTRLSTMFSLIAATFIAAACGGGGAGSSGTDAISSVASASSGSDTATDSFESAAAIARSKEGAALQAAAILAAQATTARTDADAVRLLTQATFGPKLAEIDRVRSIGASAWVDEQLAMPYDASSGYLGYSRARVAAGELMHQNQVFSNFWKLTLTAPDQLRQRLTFALSEIFVVSFWSDLADRGDGVGSYLDMLGERSTGTYRQLLEGVARHPMMGVYLSHLGNQKEDPVKGRVADENFAREVLQLFSIGLYELNLDGTPKLDSNGQPIETYTNADVQGLAKVFTGWSWAGPDKSYERFMGFPEVADAKATFTLMQGYPAYHSTAEKKFLGVTVPAQSTANPEASLKVALDTIAAHPNVGPFIGKQLIQRLVTSNPSPAYMARVAAVFNNNGSGQRGDMKAVVRAVLLDNEARDPTIAAGSGYGKVREPILRVTAWMRAFNAASASGLYRIQRTDDPTMSVAQTPIYSSSVFNFFRPLYTPAATSLSAAGLVAPEMQIADEVSTAGYVNRMVTAVMWGFGEFDSTGKGDVQANYATELGLFLQDPDALLQHLNKLLFSGRMPDELKTQIKAAWNTLPIGNNDTERSVFSINRVQLAVLLALVSPEFIVQK